jgi:hypothetical protein
MARVVRELQTQLARIAQIQVQLDRLTTRVNEDPKRR